MKILEVNKQPKVFSKEQLVVLSKKFSTLKFKELDSYGYYQIAGTKESMPVFDFGKELIKAVHYMETTYSVNAEYITHGDTNYFVFWAN